MPRAATVPKLLSEREVARILGVSRQTLWVYRTREGLPYVELRGRSIRYNPRQVAAWLKARAIKLPRATRARSAS